MKAKTDKRSSRNIANFANMIVQIAQVVKADAVICITETRTMVDSVLRMGDELHVIPAASSRETYESLVKADTSPIRLPIQVVDNYSQVRHTVSVALILGRISVGQLIVCALFRGMSREESDLILVTEVEASAGEIPVTRLIDLTDGIQAAYS
jgi:pyruvate kinase